MRTIAKRSTLAVLAMCLLSWAGGLVLPGVAAAQPASADITVLTYNVRGMPWPAASNRGAAMRAIGVQLAALRRQGKQPDMVLIQEGFIGDMAALAKASGYRYWIKGPDKNVRPGRSRLKAKYFLSGEGWGKFVSSGLHILSDIPPDRVARMAYSACAGFDCLANKGAMLVHFSAPGVPGGVDVVNTHMNSRGAAKVPRPWSLVAHHRQVDELMDFIKANHTSSAQLLVGGDFNVRNAPDRYDHDRAQRPFTVVSEFCNGAACEGQARGANAPWLKTQDLQGFAATGQVSLKPVRIAALFSCAADGGVLSDHNGYLVRYQASWTAPDAPAVLTASAPGAAPQGTGVIRISTTSALPRLMP